MYKCINGWTKKKMLKVIEARRYNVADATQDMTKVEEFREYQRKFRKE
jgi:hypothetical protein